MADMEGWTAVKLTYVEYPANDMFGHILAWMSLLPIAIGIGVFTAAALKRDLHTIFLGVGIVLNEVCNKVLKSVIQHPRPSSVEHRHLSAEYGMPSNHAQFIWFFKAYICLFVFFRLPRGQSRLDEVWKYGAALGLLIAAVGVSYGRVYLQYHSTSQVVVGLVVGYVMGMLWFLFVQVVLTPIFPVIASWPISELFLIRDVTRIPNIMWFEYTSQRQEAARRRRGRSK